METIINPLNTIANTKLIVTVSNALNFKSNRLDKHIDMIDAILPILERKEVKDEILSKETSDENKTLQ